MTANKTWLATKPGMAVVASMLLATACGSDHKGHHDGKDAGHPPGDDGGTGDGDGDGDAGTHHMDGSAGDGDASTNPATCGTSDKVCSGATPACVDGECVECSADDQTACEAGQVCDLTTHTCDKNTPFALDCADLPATGVCQGGPREVLLAVNKTGIIGMFDPTDGHFLGYFKHATPSEVRAIHSKDDTDAHSGDYHLAIQGPDQCIWTVGEGSRGIERWDTDGSFKDEVIPYDKFYDGQNLILQDPLSIGFTADKVFVGSQYGNPEARLSRFTLAGEFEETVFDNGPVLNSFIVMRDGSFVVGDDNAYAVERISADGKTITPIVGSINGPAQVSYAGDGKILIANSVSDTEVLLADIASGQASGVKPFGDNTNVYGVAQLRNGKWLISLDIDGMGVLDPASKNPTGQHESVWNDPSIYIENYQMIGRACLPTAFVDGRAPDAPVAMDHCADEPAGDPILSENFETGDFTGVGDARHFNGFVERPLPEVKPTIDTTMGANGTTHSLKIAGGPDVPDDPDQYAIPDHPSGLRATFDHKKPTYVSFYVRIDTDDVSGGFFAMDPVYDETLDYTYIASDTFTSANSNGVSKTVTKDTWIHVQMRDFDYEQRTYDLYVDCQRIGNDIPFSIYSTGTLDTLDLFNYTKTATSWYDEIVIK